MSMIIFITVLFLLGEWICSIWTHWPSMNPWNISGESGKENGGNLQHKQHFRDLPPKRTWC